MMRLVKNTIVTDLVQARKRQLSKEEKPAYEETATLRYVSETVLPFLGKHAHLLQHAGAL